MFKTVELSFQTQTNCRNGIYTLRAVFGHMEVSFQSTVCMHVQYRNTHHRGASFTELIQTLHNGLSVPLILYTHLLEEGGEEGSGMEGEG